MLAKRHWTGNFVSLKVIKKVDRVIVNRTKGRKIENMQVFSSFMSEYCFMLNIHPILYIFTIYKDICIFIKFLSGKGIENFSLVS